MDRLVKKLSEKSFQCEWIGADNRRSVAQISIPDLSQARISFWADWGPMYKLALEPEVKININFEDQSYVVTQANLELKSPLSAKERAQTPFYTVVHDSEQGREFTLYLDQNLELIRTGVVEHLSHLTSSYREMAV